MLILISGVALWWAAHLFKRVAPERRAAMGDKGKGIVAVALAVSLLMMILGYRQADTGAFWWGRTSATTGINNLLVAVAFYLYAADGMKTRITAFVRHRQLTAIVLWASAHLLVNGEPRAAVLFGGLLVWSLVQMVMINRAGPWVRPTGPFPVRKEIMAVAGAIIVTVVVGLIHGWIGPWPFGGA